MGDSAYSFSLTTFSRTGKLLQIEYALNAVANGRTSLGICAKDGVVIATDKKLTSELVDISDVHKVELLTPSCGVCYSGVGPDFRVLGKTSNKKEGSIHSIPVETSFIYSGGKYKKILKKSDSFPMTAYFYYCINNIRTCCYVGFDFVLSSPSSPQILSSLSEAIWRGPTCITAR